MIINKISVKHYCSKNIYHFTNAYKLALLICVCVFIFIYLFICLHPQNGEQYIKTSRYVHVNKIISQSSYFTYKIISCDDIKYHSAINTTPHALWQSMERHTNSKYTWDKPRRCSRPAVWPCHQFIAKPGNWTAPTPNTQYQRPSQWLSGRSVADNGIGDSAANRNSPLAGQAAGPGCCVHNASTVPWTSAGQFGRPRGVRGRPWYDLWRLRCVISHPMDVRGLPPGRPPSGRPRDTQFGIDWSLLPSGCPQGVRTAEVQPITARTHYGQEVGLPTVRPKPEVDVP